MIAALLCGLFYGALFLDNWQKSTQRRRHARMLAALDEVHSCLEDECDEAIDCWPTEIEAYEAYKACDCGCDCQDVEAALPDTLFRKSIYYEGPLPSSTWPSFDPDGITKGQPWRAEK